MKTVGSMSMQKSLLLSGCLLLISACQSGPVQKASLGNIERVMPSTEAREQYSHLLEAIRLFDESLSGKRAELSAMPLDMALLRYAHNGTAQTVGATAESVRKLTESKLIVAPGPYRLVHADTSNDRLEYRSDTSGAHLAIFIRTPTAIEKNRGASFIVSDIFSQTSLSNLLMQESSGAVAASTSSTSSSGKSIFLMSALFAGNDDAGLLAYFDKLPLPEREREDLLAIRALLLMRLDNDARARPLVEQGIVRYPDTPLYFTIARLLFERAGSTVPASLNTITQERFTPRQISDNQRMVRTFLSSTAVL